jgi:methyl-accepting chemotaxis protein
VLQWAQAQESAGRLTHEQAQQQAIEQIKALRYDQKEYFWINDMQPKMLMHPTKPELDGKDLSGIKDPNGLPLFVAFVDEVRLHGEGFVAYQWPPPGDTRPVDKVSFVKGFAPWGWVIGSGTYLDDLRNDFEHSMAFNLVLLVVTLLLAGYLFYCFYRVMDGGLRETRRHLSAMAVGDLTTSPSPWGQDEPAQLMLDLRQMQDAMRGVVHSIRRTSDDLVRSSVEIAAASKDLSARTEQAAANLE